MWCCTGSGSSATACSRAEAALEEAKDAKLERLAIADQLAELETEKEAVESERDAAENERDRLEEELENKAASSVAAAGGGED